MIAEAEPNYIYRKHLFLKPTHKLHLNSIHRWYFSWRYIKVAIFYYYAGCILLLMSGISHFKDENSHELWFMHAWSETKEKEMLTFTGNIKGQCGNCALRANCLPVPAILSLQPGWNSYLFAICFSTVETVERCKVSPCVQVTSAAIWIKIKWGNSDGNVNSKVFLNLNPNQRNIQVSALENPHFVSDTACKSASSPALLHFCIKG